MQPSLIEYLYIRLIAAAAASLMILAAVWGGAEYRNFTIEADSLRADERDRSQAMVRRIVDDVTSMIGFERQNAVKRVEDSLKRHVLEAEAIALNLAATQSEGRSKAQVDSMIREALRPIRFNNGRGYFFAFDLNGVEKLFPVRPEMEGRDMLPVRGARGEFVVRDMLAAARRDGDAYYRYFWSRPGKPGNDHLKIAYVRKIESLGWVIGAGEYVEDMEADIQAEILARIAHLRFGRDGYVFVSRWDGESLVGALKGGNPLRDGPDYLRDGTRKLIDAAQAGGGFVEYRMPAGPNGALKDKISYVQGLPEWRWMIGAGILHDDIEAALDARRKDLLVGLAVKAALGALIAALLGAASAWLVKSTLMRAQRDVEALELGLSRAAEQPQALATEDLHFVEHVRFAAAANELIAHRAQSESALIEQSRQLERSNSDLERFAYVAAHDLQEPLRTVGLFLQLLKRRAGPKLSPEESEYIDFAVGGADRMRRNIQGLLAYCRGGAHVDERSETRLDEILDRVIADLQGSIQQNGAVIRRGDLPCLPVQPDQIAALLQNLIGNALRYRKPDSAPEIMVTSRPIDNGMWEISVADNGIGIAPEFRTAIFEPFRRFNNPGAESGSGIGLALCRRVVESHGGRIWVESDEKGSVFRFTLQG